jgi:hypothetical protein
MADRERSNYLEPRFRAVINNIPIVPDRIAQPTQRSEQFFSNYRHSVVQWAKDKLLEYPPDTGIVAEVYERFEVLVEGIDQPEKK